MKVLLDEWIAHDFRHLMVGHDVFTVAFMKWRGLKNGKLLERALSEGFDALVTTDRAVPDQQHLAALPIALIVLQAATNDLDRLEPLVPALLAELNHLARRAVTHIKA